MDSGEKVRAIPTWIRSVLRKIVRYKEEHRRVLDEAATTLQLALPRDTVMNNVLPFLALPSHTFEGEDLEDGDDVNDLNEEEANEVEVEDEQGGHEEEHGNHHDDRDGNELLYLHFFDSSVAQLFMMVFILTGAIILGISIQYSQKEIDHCLA